MIQPIICFGQQPNGFFPKRFFYSKIQSARALHASLGGRIVWFCHDSDSDYRETITIFRDRQSGAEVRHNFLQPNKIQKKFSPLWAKRIAPGWKEYMARQLPRFMDKALQNIFVSVEKEMVADFCIAMYEKLGLLEGIEIVRSGSRKFREAADDLDEFYADIKYGDEIVRALHQKNGGFVLHEGGGRYSTLPDEPVGKLEKSAGRDLRFAWMQSVIHCDYYIMGASEKEYLDRNAFPGISFIERDSISEPHYAWLKTTEVGLP